MDRVAVTLYKAAGENPDGVPGEWPASVRTLRDGEKAVHPEIEMTRDELAAHQDKNRIEWADWKALKEIAAERKRLNDLIRFRSWEVEEGGTTVQGSRVSTDRQSQNLIVGALVYLQGNKDLTVDWHLADNTFATFGLAEVQAIFLAVATHVQACFTRRRQLSRLVDDAETMDDLRGAERAILKFTA